MKKTLAIILEFGFHEIKKYIHSGLAKTLAADFNIVWIALNKGSAEFDSYFKSTGFPLIYVDEKDLILPSESLEKINAIVRKNWLANQNIGAFHNHSKVRPKSWKTVVLGNSVLKHLLENWTLRRIENQYINLKIAQIYTDNHVSVVFTTGYASTFAKTTVITAKSLNLDVYYLVNSWKDLFINNFLPFKGLKGIFVWSERMKKDYLNQMKYLKYENLIISGNPTFDVLINRTPSRVKSYYASKYNLPMSAKWLLYTMMPVGLAPDEIETIIYTANQLLHDFTPEEVMIIVRKNPTHQKLDFLNLDLPTNIRIAEHFCTYDKINDMIVQSQDGEQEWLDLLQYCDINLSVPSTVSLEFMTLNKPILNIAYNSLGERDDRITQFFNAGFYRPLFETNCVLKIEHPNEICNFLRKNRTNSPEISKQPVVRASTHIIDTLKK